MLRLCFHARFSPPSRLHRASAPVLISTSRFLISRVQVPSRSLTGLPRPPTTVADALAILAEARKVRDEATWALAELKERERVAKEAAAGVLSISRAEFAIAEMFNHWHSGWPGVYTRIEFFNSPWHNEEYPNLKCLSEFEFIRVRELSAPEPITFGRTLMDRFEDSKVEKVHRELIQEQMPDRRERIAFLRDYADDKEMLLDTALKVLALHSLLPAVQAGILTPGNAGTVIRQGWYRSWATAFNKLQRADSSAWGDLRWSSVSPSQLEQALKLRATEPLDFACALMETTGHLSPCSESLSSTSGPGKETVRAFLEERGYKKADEAASLQLDGKTDHFF
ncbi:hypothetical protein JCM8097_005421 [Rhodosporidiobolus ruineniae]